MWDWIEWLFDDSLWPPRKLCGSWELWMIVGNKLAGAVIFSCYMLIPVGLVAGYAQWRERGMAFIRAPGTGLVLFVLFIAACGTGHLWSDWILFEWGVYRAELAFKLNTALWSVATIVWLFWSAAIGPIVDARGKRLTKAADVALGVAWATVDILMFAFCKREAATA